MYIAARLGYPLITVPGGYSTRGIVYPKGVSTAGPFGVIFSGKAHMISYSDARFAPLQSVAQ